MEKKIIIVAGEASGDLQAGLLISKLRELDNRIKVFSVGGEHSQKAGAQLIYDSKDLSAIGFFDVLKKIRKFKKLMRLVLDKLEEIKPEAVILVDFSGFNLRLAKKINKRLKTIYYIGPQVWASRPGRIKTIKEYIDKMLVIFKFEQDFYKKFDIDAEFIGHPLLDIVKPALEKEKALAEFGLKEDGPIFALLPGSRISEIKNILPIMLETARLIKEKLPNAQFIISKLKSIDGNLYADIINPVRNYRATKEIIREIRRSGNQDLGIRESGDWAQKAPISQYPNIQIPIPQFPDNPIKEDKEVSSGVNRTEVEAKIIEGKQYDCLNIADFVLVASGTATLETAIMQKPNVVIYKMGILNYLLYRPLVKIPFIGMENIVAGKLIAPEFIQFKAKPKLIADKVLEILQDEKQLAEIQKDFRELKQRLGQPQSPLRAAKSILALINSLNSG